MRLNPDSRVTQARVQTGRMAGERIEITGGLPADARVVATGVGFLNEGDLVRVVDAPAASAPPVAGVVAPAAPAPPVAAAPAAAAAK